MLARKPGCRYLSSGRSRLQKIDEYFNTSAFTLNALGTFGDSPRNPIRNPVYFDVDAGLQRMFPIGERFRLEFRVEEFNATKSCEFQPTGKQRQCRQHFR